MRAKLAAIVGLMCVATEAGAVTAIACTGRTRQFGLDLPPTDREESRYYVLNDDRRAILDYDERIGGYRTLCDRAEGCRASYGPKAVIFSHGTDRSYQSLHLDRFTGRILHVENLKEFSTSLFEGQCAQTAMPKADAEALF